MVTVFNKCDTMNEKQLKYENKNRMQENFGEMLYHLEQLNNSLPFYNKMINTK